MKNKKFSINSYYYLLEVILKSKRKIISFNDFFMGELGIIMRHDIDFCLEKALEIAQIENSKNIVSTYFVLLNSRLYNINDKNSIRLIKEIRNLGHSIGLHFDASKYENNFSFLNKACENECGILEKIICTEISIVSFHRPQKKLIGNNSKIANRYHTYMPDLIKDTKYCSDSGGSWYYDDPEEIILNKSISNIQLLTHPIWWTTPENLSPGEKIAFFINDYNEAIKNYAAENCKPYKTFLKTVKK